MVSFSRPLALFAAAVVANADSASLAAGMMGTDDFAQMEEHERTMGLVETAKDVVIELGDEVKREREENDSMAQKWHDQVLHSDKLTSDKRMLNAEIEGLAGTNELLNVKIGELVEAGQEQHENFVHFKAESDGMIKQKDEHIHLLNGEIEQLEHSHQKFVSVTDNEMKATMDKLEGAHEQIREKERSLEDALMRIEQLEGELSREITKTGELGTTQQKLENKLEDTEEYYQAEISHRDETMQRIHEENAVAMMELNKKAEHIENLQNEVGEIKERFQEIPNVIAEQIDDVLSDYAIHKVEDTVDGLPAPMDAAMSINSGPYIDPYMDGSMYHDMAYNHDTAYHHDMYHDSAYDDHMHAYPVHTEYHDDMSMSDGSGWSSGSGWYNPPHVDWDGSTGSGYHYDTTHDAIGSGYEYSSGLGHYDSNNYGSGSGYGYASGSGYGYASGSGYGYDTDYHYNTNHYGSGSGYGYSSGSGYHYDTNHYDNDHYYGSGSGYGYASGSGYHYDTNHYASGSGYGSGYHDSSYYASGSGYGYSSGYDSHYYGSGSGYGYGSSHYYPSTIHGSGSGYGYSSGHGSGYGSSYYPSTTYGSGSGYGYSSGHYGSGSGYGYSSGYYGSGSGYGHSSGYYGSGYDSHYHGSGYGSGYGSSYHSSTNYGSGYGSGYYGSGHGYSSGSGW